ncbi:hypothetical protein JCM10296v2_001231 [Rhodotorula toruloides]
MSGPTEEYIAQSAMLSFAPVNAIHQHVQAFHSYADSRGNLVPAHHYCACPKHTGEKALMRQCVIYDSDKADARLIGVEYIVAEEIFKKLPEDEKKYWHSHKYEVESGQLVLKTKNWVPGMVEDAAEQAEMKQLHTTYGKTIHTWAFDQHPDLPLGPPRLMMSFTGDDQVDPKVLETRDQVLGVSTSHKRELRSKYLNTSYEPVDGADQWEHTKDEGLAFEAKVVKMEQPKQGTGRTATWRGKQSLEDVLSSGVKPQ